jgi:hypothetical protein
MATAKQIAALLYVVDLVNKKKRWGVFTPEQVKKYTEKISPMNNNQVRAEFKKLNDILEFDRKTSPMTREQRTRILDLERGVYGEVKLGLFDELTFEQAHERIAFLAAARKDAAALGREAQEFVNSQPASPASTAEISE